MALVSSSDAALLVDTNAWISVVRASFSSTPSLVP